MRTDNPLVSIVIPVYNGSNYLAQAIDSALGQTYPNCEVLVVNDGSDDGGATAELALGYGEKIRYFEKENGGVATALNLGIRQMRGEYFAWLSHDDLYKPEKIELQVKAALDSGDRTRLVQSEYEFYHMPTGSRTPTNLFQLYGEEQLCRSFFSVLWLQYHACGTLIHRSHFTRAGLFDESIQTVQDIDLWFRILRDQKLVFVPQVLHSVREHAQANSNTAACYHAETRALYWRLIQALDWEEMDRVFGSASTFLCRMAGFLKSYGGGSELEQMKRLLAQLPDTAPTGAEASLEALSGGRKIAIFGAGQYGLRIKFELECRGIHPACFVDNAPSKWGTVIDGIPCIRMEQAVEQKEELFMVIAQRTLTPALEQVQSLQLPYFTTKQSLEAKLLHIPPAMQQREEWLSLL